MEVCGARKVIRMESLVGDFSAVTQALVLAPVQVIALNCGMTTASVHAEKLLTMPSTRPSSVARLQNGRGEKLPIGVGKDLVDERPSRYVRVEEPGLDGKRSERLREQRRIRSHDRRAHRRAPCDDAIIVSRKSLREYHRFTPAFGAADEIRVSRLLAVHRCGERLAQLSDDVVGVIAEVNARLRIHAERRAAAPGGIGIDSVVVAGVGHDHRVAAGERGGEARDRAGRIGRRRIRLARPSRL